MFILRVENNIVTLYYKEGACKNNFEDMSNSDYNNKNIMCGFKETL